jgi:hypothetical protein
MICPFLIRVFPGAGYLLFGAARSALVTAETGACRVGRSRDRRRR